MLRSQLFSVVGLTGVALSGLLSAGAARADIPPPPRDLPSGKVPYPIEVSYDGTKDVTFVYIGRDVLGSVVDDKKDKQSFHAPDAARSIVAAVALSLGIAGIFLLRGKRTAQLACGLLLIAGLGAIGAQAWGNAPPPLPRPTPPTTDTSGPNLRQKVFHGDAVVEVVDGDGSYRVRVVIGTKPKPEYRRPGPVNAPPTPEKKT